MSTADIIEADEAQNLKKAFNGQPIFENLLERDNHYFLKGSKRGAEKMKAALIDIVKGCNFLDKSYDVCIEMMKVVEV